MTKRVYLAEKPSAGKDLAAVLGVTGSGEGFKEVKDGWVTWGFGHLLENCQPEEYNPEWKSWEMRFLPMLPEPFRSSPKDDAKGQLKTIASLLKKADEVVLATDWDREGELIGVEILEHLKWSGKTQRLCLTALDPESIKKALGKLRPAAETDALARAAHARSMADWIVGLNMTRALTRCFSTGKGDVVSVGRVQTPTFALVVRRDRAIKNFKSLAYYELVADVTSDGHKLALRHSPGEDDRYTDKPAAQAVADAAEGREFPLAVKKSAKKKGPKKLFDLGGLQKACNGAFGWTADQTLDIAQALYEKHKITSYPRTDCVFLPEEQEADVPKVVAFLDGLDGLEGFFRLGFSAKPILRSSVFNTSKVTAHHAIVPLAVEVDLSKLSANEKKAYLLIAKRYLSALAPDMEYDETQISIDVPVSGKDSAVFKVVGRVVRVPGWTGIEAEEDDGDDAKDDSATKLPPVEDGAAAAVVAVSIDAKKTQPPKPYTEATLLADMESVAKFCDDPKLKAVLKETSGIGTPATRAAILKTIRERGYVRPEGKKLLSTEKSQRIFDILAAQFPALIDPAETARWEDALNSIAEGGERKTFSAGIAEFTTEAVNKLRSQESASNGSGASGSAPGRVAEGSPTGVTDPRTEKEFLDYGDHWRSAMGIRCFKAISGRPMTLDDFVAIMGSKEPVPLTGFKSTRTGKEFDAGLVVKKEGPFFNIVFVFDKSPGGGSSESKPGVQGKATGVTDPRTSKEFLDYGDTWRSAGGVKCWKELSGRAMKLTDFVKIMGATAPVPFKGFKSKRTGKEFDAGLVVKKEGEYLNVVFDFGEKK